MWPKAARVRLWATNRPENFLPRDVRLTKSSNCCWRERIACWGFTAKGGGKAHMQKVHVNANLFHVSCQSEPPFPLSHVHLDYTASCKSSSSAWCVCLAEHPVIPALKASIQQYCEVDKCMQAVLCLAFDSLLPPTILLRFSLKKGNICISFATATDFWQPLPAMVTGAEAKLYTTAPDFANQKNLMPMARGSRKTLPLPLGGGVRGSHSECHVYHLSCNSTLWESLYC